MKTRHLLKRKQTWYVRKRIPPSLSHVLGAEIQRTTGTRDLDEARRRRWAILAAIQRQIDFARERAGSVPGSADWVKSEARAMLQSVRDGETSRDTIDHVGLDYLLSELVKLKGYRLDAHGHPIITDEKVSQAVTGAAELLSGGPDLIRLSDSIQQYISENSHLQPSTIKSKRRRLTVFADWTGDKPVGAITRMDTGRYLSEVLLTRKASAKTTQDTIGTLGTFFKWARLRGFTETNPFEGQTATVKSSTRGGQKYTRRPWSPDELLTMLEGLSTGQPMDTRLRSLLAIGAYSGMRLNEICETELADAHDTHIHLPEPKTESSVRDVPLHPILLPLIAKLRSESTDGYLIDGLKRGGEDGKRGHYASKRFGARKRDLGVVDMYAYPNGRQSDRIDFHALRGTFISAMQREGVPMEVRKAITGHASSEVHIEAYMTYDLGVLAKAVQTVSYGDLDKLILNIGDQQS
jgi:integrase